MKSIPKDLLVKNDFTYLFKFIIYFICNLLYGRDSDREKSESNTIHSIKCKLKHA